MRIIPIIIINRDTDTAYHSIIVIYRTVQSEDSVQVVDCHSYRELDEQAKGKAEAKLRYTLPCC